MASSALAEAAGSDSNILTQCAREGAGNNTELQRQKRRPHFDAIGIPIDQSVVKDQRERTRPLFIVRGGLKDVGIRLNNMWRVKNHEVELCN